MKHALVSLHIMVSLYIDVDNITQRTYFGELAHNGKFVH